MQNIYFVKKSGVGDVSEKRCIVDYYPNFAQFLKTLVRQVNQNTTEEAIMKSLYPWFYGKEWDDAFEYNESNKPGPYEYQKLPAMNPEFRNDYKQRDRHKEITEELKRRKLLTQITESLQNKIREAINKNCPITGNLETVYVHDILQNMTIEWANQESYEHMRKFVKRRVHDYGKNVDSFDFKNVDLLDFLIESYKANERNEIIQHLFKDTSIAWLLAHASQAELARKKQATSFSETQKNQNIKYIFDLAQNFAQSSSKKQVLNLLQIAMHSFYQVQYRRRIDKTITDKAVDALLKKMEQETVSLEQMEDIMHSLFKHYENECIEDEKTELQATERKIFESLKRDLIQDIFRVAQDYIATDNDEKLAAFTKGSIKGKLWNFLTVYMEQFYTLVYQRDTDTRITDVFVKKLVTKMQKAQVPLENIEETMDLLYLQNIQEIMDSLSYKTFPDGARIKVPSEIEVPNTSSELEEKKKTNYAAWVEHWRQAKGTTHRTRR